MQFNKLINSILKEEDEAPSREDRIKALDNLEVVAEPVKKKYYSPYENEFTFEEDFPWAKVSDYLQDATSNEDDFYLHGTATVGFSIVPGQRGGWTDPSWDPYPEVNDVEWSDDVKLLRTNAEGNLVEVTPESIGVELYDRIVNDLKAKAEKHAIEETEENGMELASDFNEPDHD
jgi:hypothetical protein